MSRQIMGLALILLFLIVPLYSGQRKPALPTGPKYLAAIKSQAEFDLLKRIYYRGSFASIPHLMFVIDREQNNQGAAEHEA